MDNAYNNISIANNVQIDFMDQLTNYLAANTSSNVSIPFSNASTAMSSFENLMYHSQLPFYISSYEEAMEYNLEYNIILSSSILKKLTNRIKELESLNLERWTSLIEKGDDNG